MSQPVVIVRAFKGEPRKLVVIDANAGRVSVADPASLKKIENGDTAPVSLPRTQVFEYSDDAFSRLRDTWAARGETGPDDWMGVKLWGGSVHHVPA